jgi:hypothetical protein
MEEYKDIVLDVDVNTSKRDCKPTGQEFCSYDQQSARIVVNITKGGEPIQADSIKAIRLFMASSDGYGRIIAGMQYQTVIEKVTNGQVVHILPDEYLKYVGRAVIHVYVIFDNGPTNDAGQSFLINFKKSAIDDSEAGNIVPNYFKSFDDILTEVQYAADEKIEEISSLGIDIGEFVKDYLAESPDIATKDYVNAKADVSDNVLMAWLFLEAEGE